MASSPLENRESFERKREEKEGEEGGDTLAGKGKTEKIREDLSLDRLSKSETASLRPYFFPV